MGSGQEDVTGAMSVECVYAWMVVHTQPIVMHAGITNYNDNAFKVSAHSNWPTLAFMLFQGCYPTVDLCACNPMRRVLMQSSLAYIVRNMCQFCCGSVAPVLKAVCAQIAVERGPYIKSNMNRNCSVSVAII